MKLFRLIWIVHEGSCEYYQSILKVFDSEENAAKYGISKEIENNTGDKPDHDYSEEEKCNIYIKLAKENKRYFQFIIAEEYDCVKDENCNDYEVSIRKKDNSQDEKKGNQS
jgi:hypothetical protein